MEVALTDVPIPVEATSVHADVAMNSREMEHLEVELEVWLWTQSLMLDDPVKVLLFYTQIIHNLPTYIVLNSFQYFITIPFLCFLGMRLK